MAKRLAGNFINLVYEAAARSFHRRKALSRCLRQAGVSEKFIATGSQDDSKRDLLNLLLAALRSHTRGCELALRMARDLAAQDAFPDLLGWENSEVMLQQAVSAVRALRTALAKID